MTVGPSFPCNLGPRRFLVRQDRSSVTGVTSAAAAGETRTGRSRALPRSPRPMSGRAKRRGGSAAGDKTVGWAACPRARIASSSASACSARARRSRRASSTAASRASNAARTSSRSRCESARTRSTSAAASARARSTTSSRSRSTLAIRSVARSSCAAAASRARSASVRARASSFRTSVSCASRVVRISSCSRCESVRTRGRRPCRARVRRRSADPAPLLTGRRAARTPVPSPPFFEFHAGLVASGVGPVNVRPRRWRGSR